MVDSPNVKNPTVIVLSPLLALISNKVLSSNSNIQKSLEINASSLDSNFYDDISTCKFNLLHGTPEQFLTNFMWRTKLQSNYFANDVVCFIFDEVHKVTWGATSRPFR